MQLSLLFEQIIAKKHLNEQQMQYAVRACMTGDFSDAQMAAFLALMRMKGETADELTTAAMVMKSFSHPIDLGEDVIDIVGTGGDGKNSFNVSTACSFVVAASGINVAKHGNRSVSGKSGSADLLEKANIPLYLNEQHIKQCINECGIAFLFAPQFHPAMNYAQAARRELGIRTLFNLLGPLLNPAQVKRQVVGVFTKHWMQPLATVLANLGSKRFLVVNSEDGMDEISIAAKTTILEFRSGQFHSWTLDPKDIGLAHPDLDEITVNSSMESLEMIHSVFRGDKGAPRDIVLLNSAAAIYCAKDEISFNNALEKARFAIDNGKAAACFTTLQQLTRNV